MKRTDVKAIYSLSPMQEGMLFHARLDDSSTAYFEQMAVTLSGRLRFDLMEKTLNLLTARYDVLRTVFTYKKTRVPRQVVLKKRKAAARYENISHLAPPAQKEFIAKFKEDDRKQGFDLSKGPLIRSALLELSPESYILVWSYHHILMDGWCFGIIFKDFIEIYTCLQNGETPALPPAAPYIRFIKWLEKQDKKSGLAHWRRYLSGYDRRAVIPCRTALTNNDDYLGGKRYLFLEESLTAQLDKTARTNQVTFNTLVQTLWGLLLQVYNNTDDVVFGAVVSGRPPDIPGINKMVGLFINTVPVRVRVGAADGLPFNTLLEQVHKESILSRAFEYLPLAEIQSQSELKHELMHHILGFESFPMQEGGDDESGDSHGPAVEEIEGYEQTNYQFNVMVVPGPQLEVKFMFNALLYEPAFVERMLSHLQNMILQVTENPALNIATLDILSEEERRQLLVDFNGTATPYRDTETIHDVFRYQAARTPDSTAIVDSASTAKTKLSYAQLDERAEQLARNLRDKGVSPGVIVGIMVDKSVEMITGILAVLKAGAAYLPIDPQYPRARKLFILKDSGIRFLLTQHHLKAPNANLVENIRPIPPDADTGEPIRPVPKIELLPIDDENIYAAEITGTLPVTAPTDPAYIIYTSGTTGVPKGVVVRHRGLVSLNTCFRKDFGLTTGDRVLQFASISFDASVWEIFMALLNGATLYLPDPETIGSTGKFENYMEANGITVVTLPPAYALQLDTDSLHTLRILITAGSAAPRELVEKYRSKLRYINAYGPTESTVCATYWKVPAAGALPHRLHIGTPVPNTQIHILDTHNRLLPKGVPGELCISGTGLAAGYLNRPELTALRFARSMPPAAKGRLFPPRVAGPLEPLWPLRAGELGTAECDENDRVYYRTGDLALWMEDGNVEFLGRIDTQVKIRGFRIELGEIENVLLKQKKIKEATVQAVCDDNGGDTFLAAYLVPTADGFGTEEDLPGILNLYLTDHLPAYMIPSYFVELTEIPMTPNGKVDTKALPEPRSISADSVTGPRDELEKQLAGFWSEILGVSLESIGIDADFFRLGGHSLKASMMVAAVHKELQIDLPLSEVFEKPTIRQIARYLRRASGKVFSAVNKAPEQEYYPLSSAQKRIFLLQYMEPDNIHYNISLSLPLPAGLEREKVLEIFNTLIKRHESLRTSFHMKEGQPVQKIHSDVPFTIPPAREADQSTGIAPNPPCRSPFTAPKGPSGFQGPRHAGWEEPPLGAPRVGTAGGAHAFDLSKAPLLRVELQEETDGSTVMEIDIHHIITDGSSQEILTREFAQLAAGEVLAELPLQYRDYVLWQQSDEQQDSIKRQEEYWLKQFSHVPPVLHLPADFPRPAVQQFDGADIRVYLSTDETAALKELARQSEATLYMVLTAAFSMLLSRLSGLEDVVVGTSTAGRRHADLQAIMGMFVNTLPLRFCPESDKTVSAFLKEVKEVTLDAFENQDYPFEELVQKLELSRDIGSNPLFDFLFVLQNQASYKESVSDISSEIEDGPARAAKFDMSLTAVEMGANLLLDFNYCTQLFTGKTVKGFARYFKRLLVAIAGNPAQQLHQIELLTPEEKRHLIMDFNQTAEDYPADKTLNQLFRAQAEKYPASTALTGPSLLPSHPEEPLSHLSLTYREYDRQAGLLARILIQKGVKSDTIVAVMLDRSIEMMIAFMAVLKAGGSYLPILPHYPADRIDYILEDSNSSILLTKHPHYMGRGTVDHRLSLKRETIYLEDFPKPDQLTVKGPPPPEPSESDEQAQSPTDLAYIIYTSGSTGKPKGVAIEHRSVVNLLFCLQTHYPFTSVDTYLFKTPCVFDVSVSEIFGWFIGGGRLAVLPEGDEKDPVQIAAAVEEYHVTHINFVPSMFSVFVDGLTARTIDQLNSLKAIFLAGEALPASIVEKCKAKGIRTPIENLYGPTEATVYASRYSLRQWSGGTIPIGTPTANLQLHIIDKYQSLQPIGVAGELCISGKGLARGYVNRPELTADTFIANPFRDSQHISAPHSHHNTVPTDSPLYKTGDLAKWLPDGNIEYLGRIDTQVKIRGFRIELGEIENRLLKHPRVKEAVVSARAENTYLCAYVTATNLADGTEKEPGSLLKDFLSSSLPEYMIPSYFVFLPNIPLTPNGKVDRSALPEPEALSTSAYVAPLNDTESTLTGIWADVLGLKMEKIGMNDNFFELGGHSLKAINLTTFIHRDLEVKLPVFRIFKSPTIRGLATHIREEAGKTAFSGIAAGEKREYYPLSAAQKRMYALNRFEKEGSTNYNIPSVLTIGGALDKLRLESAFTALVQRHESFRTGFFMKDGEPVQRVHDTVDFTVRYYEDVENVDDTVNAFIAAFNLSEAPLLRVGLIRRAADTHILLVDMHHIIADGASLSLLTGEFIQLYQGHEPPPLRLGYRDFCLWRNSFAHKGGKSRQESYWKAQFAAPPPVLQMPLDFPRPALQVFEGDSYVFQLNATLTAALRKTAADSGVTPYMLFLAAYVVLLGRYCGQEDIVIGSPTAGRSHADLQPVIGMFVNTLAMRNYPAGALEFATFLDKVKESTLNAFENQDYQFEDLVELLDIPRDLSRNPLFDTMFTLENLETAAPSHGVGAPSRNGDTPPAVGGTDDQLTVSPFHFENKVAKFDLQMTVTESETQIGIRLQYCIKLFKQETMARMADHFTNILERVTENHGIPLREIEILNEEERRQLTVTFNQTGAEYTNTKTLPQLFEEQVAKYPDNAAIIRPQGHDTFFGSGEKISYQELNEAANSIAHTLRESGVGPGAIVGILAHRSAEMLAAIWGILKAGGAYLPLDPGFPAGRSELMLTDSSVAFLLASSDLTGSINSPGRVIPLDDRTLFQGNPQNPEPAGTPLDLAYIIYTSGTTGLPKGTAVLHDNVVRVVKDTNYIEITEKDVLLQLSNYAFDGSVFDIFGAFLNGATLVPVPKEAVIDAAKIIQIIHKQKVSVFFITAALFNALVDVAVEDLKPLRKIVFGGERASFPHVERALAVLGKGRLINGYGPTETTVFAATHAVDTVDRQSRSIPIGKPISGTEAYIVDTYGRLQPVGVPGELYIGGRAVTRGYLNRPETTFNAFGDPAGSPKGGALPTPRGGAWNANGPSGCKLAPTFQGDHDTRGRLYKTGDLARWLPDGNIQYLDRIDSQVKIRGFRIELGEIETQLSNHASIKETIVIDRVAPDGTRFLCAYYDSDAPIDRENLKEFIIKDLPAYMVPDFFIHMDALPINTTTGKINRKLLPEPKAEPRAQYQPPTNQTEERLQQIWQQLLGLEKIGIHDDFFQIGGNSIKALRLVSDIAGEFDLHITVTDIFTHTTIKAIAGLISGNLKDMAESDVNLLNRENPAALFCFPPGIGFGIIYKELAGLFPDRAFYGFNFIEAPDRLQQYAGHINRLQPEGTVRLLGWSAGGHLAFEVAKELEKQGREVSDIVFLDALVLPPEARPQQFDAFLESVESTLESLGLQAMKEKVLKRTTAYLEYWGRLQLQGKVNARLHMLSAQNKDHQWSPSDWNNYTAAKLHIYEASGLHVDMLSSPHLEENADLIKQILADFAP
ncbi:MAG: amino acid adenylation domain-containing protein [bacterium]|nr:amino acid adenylation domain-containing protein [bacterium]